MGKSRHDSISEKKSFIRIVAYAVMFFLGGWLTVIAILLFVAELLGIEEEKV